MSERITLLVSKLKEKTSESQLRWTTTSDPDGYSCQLPSYRVFIKKLTSSTLGNAEYEIYVMEPAGEVIDRYHIRYDERNKGLYFDSAALFNLAKRSAQGQGNLIDEILRQL